jgi:hypothetical protein
MNILKILKPESKEVIINNKQWIFPYRVWNLIELEKVIIVHFLSKEFREHCPKEIYIGCNIWCYNKNDKSVKWIIEEPPIAINDDGIIWNRTGAAIPSDWPKTDRDECYLDISYSKYDDTLDADTTGARRFRVDPDTGKVTLIATGIY